MPSLSSKADSNGSIEGNDEDVEEEMGIFDCFAAPFAAVVGVAAGALPPPSSISDDEGNMLRKAGNAAEKLRNSSVKLAPASIRD